MTRNGFESPAPYDFAGQLIAHEADAFARRWGLDVERVRRILARTATDYDGQPLPEASPVRDNLDNGLRFDPSLSEALGYLDPNDALALFEQTDPVVVARRARLVAYLGDPSSPSFATAGLADALEA